MLNRKTPPAIKDAVDMNLQLKPYEKAVLDNGIEVYAINAGAEDVVQLEWVYRAGNWFEPKNLVAASTNFLLKNGTSAKNAFQINEHFEWHGAYLNRSCQNEMANVTLHALSKHLDKLLPVVKELLTDSVFPEDELAIYKQNMKQRLQVNLKKCDFVANRLIDAYLYGEQHPYGKFTRHEDFEAVTRADVQAFYENYYKAGKPVLFVAGKLPGHLFQLLNSCFGDLKTSETPIAPIATAPAAEKKYRIINEPDGVQGAVRLGSPFPNRHHPHFVKAQVLNNIFGGFFGSRLMTNIREDKGYTYGIHSFLENNLQQSAWIISTEAGRDVCEATITETYNEMSRLRSGPVGEDELLLVRNYMLGSVLGDLDGPFQIINRWKTIILNGLPDDFFYKQMQIIKTVSAEELQQLANIYLQPENFYELVVV